VIGLPGRVNTKANTNRNIISLPLDLTLRQQFSFFEVVRFSGEMGSMRIVRDASTTDTEAGGQRELCTKYRRGENGPNDPTPS